MKSIKISLLVIMSMFIIFISFLNFSTLNERVLNKNSNSYTISKPIEFTNEQFLKIMVDEAIDNDVNLIYQENEFIDEKLHTTFYSTNNNSLISNYLNIESDYFNENSIFNFGDSGRKLRYFNIFSNTSISNFNLISKFDLSNARYQIIANEDDLLLFLDELNFEYVKDNSKQFYESSLYLETQLYIYFLIFVCFVVSVFLRKKQDTIMLSFGYSVVDIFIVDLINVVKILSLNFILVIISSFVISIMININALFSFLSYMCVYYFIHVLIIISITLISNLLIFKIKLSQVIRGYKLSNRVIISAVFIKLIILILIISSLDSTINDFNVINNNFISQKIVMNKVSNYATMPINLKQYAPTSQVFEQVDKESLNLYNNTATKLNGILIDTSNYRVIDNELNMCELLNQCFIYVNYNYIKENNISNNELIYADDKVKLLIPENHQDRNSMIDFMNQNYEGFSVDDVYSYDDNLEIFTYNEFSKDNGGYLKSIPIIVLPNSSTADSQYFLNITSAISGGYYFVKVDPNFVYDSIKPYLSVEGLKYFKSASLISSNFQKNIDSLQMQVLSSGIYIFMNVMLLIISIFIITKIFIFKNEKLYAIQSLHGYSMYLILKNYYIINIILYILLMLLFQKHWIIIGLFMFDLILNLIISKKILSKNLNKIIRGDG